MAQVRYDADAAKAVRASNDLAAALDKVDKNADESAKKLTKAEKAAERLARQADPVQQYEHQMGKLARAVKDGGLAHDKAEKLARKYGDRLDRVGRQTKKAAGPDVLANLGGVLGSWTSIGGAIAYATQQLGAYNQRRTEAETNAKAGATGFGALAQLAVTSADTKQGRKAALDSLSQEAQLAFASGATKTLEDAASLVFSLNSAGLNRQDRDFLVRAQASDVVGDSAGFSTAIAAFQGAFDISAKDLTSKALAVSKVAPAQANEIVQAAAGLGPLAKAVGVSDDFVLAATAQLAKSTGSASQGATQLGAILGGLAKEGQANDPTLKGLTGVELIKELASRGAAGDINVAKKFLGGRKEGFLGLGTLAANIGSVESLVQDSSNAARLGLADESISLAQGDRVFGAAREQLAAENEAKLQGVISGETRSLVQAARERLATFDRAEGNQVENAINDAAIAALLTVGQDQTALSTALGFERQREREFGGEGAFTADFEQRILAALERTADNTEPNGASTRQE